MTAQPGPRKIERDPLARLGGMGFDILGVYGAHPRLDAAGRTNESMIGPSSFRLVAVEEALVAAQNRELDAAIAHLDAVTALDQTLGVTLDRWNIEIDTERDGVSP